MRLQWCILIQMTSQQRTVIAYNLLSSEKKKKKTDYLKFYSL